MAFEKTNKSEKALEVWTPKPINVVKIPDFQTAKDFLEENVNQIIELLMQEYQWADIAAHYGITVSAIFWWKQRSKHKELISEAMEWRAEIFADGALKILQDGLGEDSVPQAMLRQQMSKYKQWYASKLKPKLFGDNKSLDLNVAVTHHNVSDEQFDAIMEKLEKKHETLEITEHEEITDENEEDED